MKGERHKGYFPHSLSLIHRAASAIQLSSIFNDFFISGLRRRFVCAFMYVLSSKVEAQYAAGLERQRQKESRALTVTVR